MNQQHAFDLAVPVEAADHVIGASHAPVTIVEYGDFECPMCRQAEPAVQQLLVHHPSAVRLVFRHFPIESAHPHALLAAEAAEAAGADGKFWEMHDLLLANQDKLRIFDLLRYAGQLGLDQDRFHEDMMRRANEGRIAADLESADLSGVSGTPTFFVNGRRHYGAYDVHTLKQAIRTARVRAKIAARQR